MIKLKGISKFFDINYEKVSILKDINLCIDTKEFIAILGKSGSGKTTLLNILGFLDRRFEGEYTLNGKSMCDISDNELSEIRNKHIGFVFQNFSLIDTMSVLQNIELPLMYSNISASNAKSIGKKCLAKVGLEGYENRSVRYLSGGQRQRVAIARALSNSPMFIIADEPTGSLDSKTSSEIMRLFKDLNQQGITIILVTHDESLISYCDRVIYLSDGRIIE